MSFNSFFIIIAAVIVVAFAMIRMIRNEKAQIKALQREESLRRQAEEEAAAAAEIEAVNNTMFIPQEQDGKYLVYKYPDVLLEECIPSNAIINVPVTFELADDAVHVIQSSCIIGSMPRNNLSKMVRDWYEAGDPIVAFVSYINEHLVVIAIGFYQDTIARFLARNNHAKLIKLAGKPDDLAIYSKGQRCEVKADDFEPDRYYVLADGDRIGKLPASAIKYANDHDTDPEMLEVIIADDEYDILQERDIISVYISD